MAIVRVEKELEELIPGFLKNKRKDLDNIHTALQANDFKELKRLGHKVSGSAGGYGFEVFGELANKLETLAASGRKTELEKIYKEMVNHLENVEIVFE